jgi:hypothetical protein
MGSIFDLNKLSAAIDRAATAPSALEQETQRMRNALGGDGYADTSYMSLSAQGTSDLVKSLQPVSLGDDDLTALESFFYSRRPRRGGRKAADEDEEEDNDGSGIQFSPFKRPGNRAWLIPLFDQITDVTNSINVFMFFMRDLLNNGRRLFEAEQDPQRLTEVVQSLFIQSVKYRNNLKHGDDSSLNSTMYSLIGAMMQGDKHSVRPSQVYSGGVDVVLARSSRDLALMCSDISYGGYLESDSTEYGYEQNRMAAYSTETCLRVKEAAKQILAYVFGEGSEHAAFEPQLRTLPITTDFTEIQRIFERVVGISLTEEFFHNVTFGAENDAYAERFVRIGLVLHAEKGAAQRLQRSFSNEAVKSGTAMEDLLSHEVVIKHRVSQDTTTEAALLNRVVGGTVTFTFDKATANFITQTAANSKINYSSFDNWFSIWSSQFLRKPNTRVKNTIGQGRVKLSNIPRYVLPVSKLGDITKARQRMGMSVEETRANEDGLYITPSGNLAYLPTQQDREQLTSVHEFEKLGADLAETCATYGINMSVLSGDYVTAVQYGIPFQVYTESVEKLKKLTAFEGSVLSYDWDYGLRVYASSRPGIVRCDVQIGAVKPDTLVIADYLGYNMARPNEAPLQKSFADSVMLMTHEDPLSVRKEPKELFGDQFEVDRWVRSDQFAAMFNTYFFHAYKGELPGLQELCNRAMQELNIPLLNADAPRQQSSRIYSGIIKEDGTIRDAGITQEKDVELLNNILTRTATNCSGRNGTWVASAVQEELGSGADYLTVQEQIKDHEDYFVPNLSPANHFARLFNFIGGNMLKQMMDGINSLSVNQLTNGETTHVTEYNQNYRLSEMPAKMVKQTSTRPDSAVILNIVKPLTIMFGKYAQNYEEFEAEAEEAIKSIERDDSIEPEDIHFAGSSAEFSVFPHQLDTHRYLRKPKPPKFAVLDISPGGGKTSIGLGDMACIVKDMQAVGKKVRPLVLCPDGLVRNWCDDMKTFAGGNWNMIPIDNAVFKRWGAERLQQIIDSAPPNTIVVAGLNFLRNNKMSIVIGNAVINVGTNLEFIKAFKFNYIIIDESHKLKNPLSIKSKITRQLTTASFVDYLRIATGTLIADRVKDIEGQTALYSPHIFRSGELSQTTEVDDDLELGDDKVQLWKVNTPQRARQRLSRYAAVITKKKKEWAFMLPNPIENFHTVDFVPTDGTEDDIRFGELHRELYDLVVQESIDDLEKLIAQAKSRRKASAAEDDGEDDDDDDGEEKEGVLREADLELDSNDEFSMLSVADVTAYLQRIERLIITPEHDPLFERVFGSYGKKKYVSQKARVIVNIVDEHFNPPKWDKGKNYHEFDLVQQGDDLYLARKSDLTTPRREMLPRDTIGKPPSQNNDLWKKEPEGKIIIFCRYTNSVEAVYRALPDRYKALAVRFTGEEVDKWSNLDAFKSDPKVKILIANEMGLSEGHNLQMASRMIRVESPWGPGELDQSASRIFRPDPKGAKAGEIYREAVYLDWVIADHTMEVAKQGRLIAKIFNKARFDEADNPRYQKVLESYNLWEVSMSIAGTLQQRPSFAEYSEFVQGYAALNGLLRQEFHEMRTTMPASMIEVPQTANVDGAGTILTPFVSSQDIPDPNNWKPRSLKQYLRSDLGKEFREDPQRLIGQPVITDMGNGMIVNAKARYVGKAKDRVLDPTRPVSSIMVKLKDGTMISFNDLGLAYVPTNITAKEIKSEFAVDVAFRKADLLKLEKLQRDQDKLDAITAAKDAKKRQREDSDAAVRLKSMTAADKRKKNIREGKPINQGVRYEKDLKIPTTVEREEVVASPVSLSPAFYHGFLTLETDDLEYAKALKRLKFKEIGEYAFAVVNRRNQANAVMDYIEEHFHLSDKTAERLGAVFSAFEKGKRGLYNMELSPSTEIPHFFATRKQMVTDRLEARIFPFFMHDKLMLVCDVATCPIIKKHIGKAIPEGGTKWQLSQGALMYFAQNKTDLNNKIKEVKAAGIEIANPDVLKKEVAEIAFRAPKKAK